MPTVTWLRLSDISVICHVTYFQFPIQSAYLQYISVHFPSPGHVPGMHYHLTLNWSPLIPASARNSRHTSSVFYCRNFLLVFSILLLVFYVCNYWHWIVRRRWAPVRGTLQVYVMMMMMMIVVVVIVEMNIIYVALWHCCCKTTVQCYNVNKNSKKNL